MKNYLKKIFTVFTLIVVVTLQFAQIGEQVVFALDKEMKFSYTSSEKKVFYNDNYDYYSSYREARLDNNIAYCVDYGRKLPSGELKYKRSLSQKAMSILVYGYPNRSASELGVNNNEEAYIATQLAFWSVIDSTGEAKKSKLNFNYNDLKPVKGKEDLLKRVKAGAKKLEAYAKANPYNPTYTMKLDSSSAKIEVVGDKIVAGPYKVTNTGFNNQKAKVKLLDAPKSAKIVNKAKKVQTSFSKNEEIYVTFDSSEKGSTFKLKTEYSTNKYTGAIYGTSKSDVQDYATVVKSPVAMDKSKSITWDNKTGNVEVLKVDQDNNVIIGVKFDLKDSTGKKIAEGTTNEKGVVKFTDLTPGKYTIVETYVPGGYIMGDKPISFVVKTGETYKETIVNKKIKGSFKINKKDKDGKPIKNVVFEILDSNKNVITQVVTDVNGIANVTDLKEGTYYYREVGGPDNIVTDKNVYPFNITAQNQIVTKNIVNDVVNGSLKIIKKDSDAKPIQGVVFQILDSNRNIITEIITNSDGIATANNLTTGIYYYKEIKAPTNVIMDKKEYEFSVTKANQVITKEIVNELVKGSLKIVKVDSNKNPISGVKFQILNSNKQVVEEITTNASGIAVSKELVNGKYYYKEVSAPDNVIMDTKEYEFNVNSSNAIIEREVVNELAKGGLKIIKTDSNNNVLAGVKFAILNSSKEVIKELVTNDEGVILVENLTPGKYYYKEVSAPNNVIIDSKEYPFDVEGNNIITKEIVNQIIKGSLKILKIDEEGNPIENVKFDILDSNKNVVQTITTDREGIAITKELEHGIYYYKEVNAPSGVIMDLNEHEFEVKENSTLIEKEVVNKYETAKLKIIKLSDETKQPLSGVKFDILDSNKKIIETIITDEEGIAYSSELKVGTYYYKEIVTKDGYILDTKEYKFKIKGNNQDVEAVVYNKKVLGFLPQTGGKFSSDVGLILMVIGISIMGYIFLKVRKKTPKYKQLTEGR